MEIDFVTHRISEKLKEKGFREKCFATYTSYSETLKLNEINTDKRPVDYKLNIEEFRECYNYYTYIVDAPTIAQVLKWLRKEKRIDAGAIWSNDDKVWVGYVNDMNMPDLVSDYVLPNNSYDSYEDAALHAIEYILDNNLI